MRKWLSKIWCAWTHGGGNIERDPEGRINWRCNRCGRWSDEPVDPDVEGWVLDHELAEYEKRRRAK